MKAVDQALFDFQEEEKKGHLTAIPTSYEEITRNDLHTLRFPLDEIETLPPGIYWTYYDFLNVRPEPFSGIEYIVERGEKNTEYLRLSNRPYGRDFPFAVVNGENTYLQTDENFYQSAWKRYDKWYVLVKGAGDGTIATVGAISFGLVGAFVGYVIDEAVAPMIEYPLNIKSPLLWYPHFGSRSVGAEPTLLVMSEFLYDHIQLQVEGPDEMSCVIKAGDALLISFEPGIMELEYCFTYKYLKVCHTFYPNRYTNNTVLIKPKQNDIKFSEHPAFMELNEKLKSGELSFPCQEAD